VTFYSISIGFAGCFLKGSVVSILGVEKCAKYLKYIPISVFFAGSYAVLNFWFTRHNGISELSLSRVVDAFSSRTAAICAAILFHMGALGLIVARLLGQFSAIVTLCWSFPKTNFGDVKTRVNTAVMWAQVRRYRAFAVYSLSALLGSVRRELPILAVGFLFGPAAVGFFAVSHRVVGRPLNLISDSVTKSFYQRAAEKCRSSESITQLSESLLNVSLSVAFVPLLVLAVVAEEFFGLFFGLEWKEAGKYFQAIWIFLLCVYAFRPLSVILDILERQRELLIFNVVLFGASIAAFILGARGDNATKALFFFSATNLILYIYMITWTLNCAGVSVKRTVEIIVNQITVGFLFGGIAWIGKLILQKHIWLILGWGTCIVFVHTIFLLNKVKRPAYSVSNLLAKK
jgi:O-antigen/teichoic acid export membrane protein